MDHVRTEAQWPHTTVCQACGRGPARELVIRRHVGLLVMQRFIKLHAVLCRECGVRTTLRYTGRTLVEGWWGLFSFFVGNPFTIVMNVVALIKARRIDPPQRSVTPMA
jgi:hypothetical protein